MSVTGRPLDLEHVADLTAANNTCLAFAAVRSACLCLQPQHVQFSSSDVLDPASIATMISDSHGPNRLQSGMY